MLGNESCQGHQLIQYDRKQCRIPAHQTSEQVNLLNKRKTLYELRKVNKSDTIPLTTYLLCVLQMITPAVQQKQTCRHIVLSRLRSKKERGEEHARKRATSVKEGEFAPFPLFARQQWKPASRAQSHSALGKARVLSKRYEILNINGTFRYQFHNRLSRAGYPVLAVLSGLSSPSCTGNPVLAALFSQPGPSSPVLLFYLSSSAYLSACHDCLSLFCLSHSSMSCSACPVLASLSWLYSPCCTYIDAPARKEIGRRKYDYEKQ
jgi:hypothetical protein